MSLFLIRWLFNAMNNAIFTGGVIHGVICGVSVGLNQPLRVGLI